MHRLPNILSGLRILLSPVFLFLFFQDAFIWKFTGLVVFIIAAVTDYFDGYFARKYQSQSSFGVFLDPLADKVLTFSGFFVLPFIDPAQFPLWAIILIYLRDIGITVFRIYSNRKKLPMATRMTAKIKTTIQMVFLYIGLVVGLFYELNMFLGDWVRWVLDTNVLFYLMMFVTSVTVYSGIEYIVINRAVFNRKHHEVD